MGRIIKWLLLCTLLLALAIPLGIYFLVLSDAPMALPISQTEQQDLTRIKTAVERQLAQTDANGRSTLHLNEKDVNTALSFGIEVANMPFLEGAALDLDNDQAVLRGSVALPIKLGRRFVDFHATLQADGNTPHIEHLQLGVLPLPAALLQRIEDKVYEALRTRDDLRLARNTWQSIEDIRIEQQLLTVDYRLSRAALGGNSNNKFLTQQMNAEAVEAYIAYLEPISNRLSSSRFPLMGMLAPAFELAEQRSAEGNSPVMENSAALLSVAMYTADPNVLEVLGLGDQFGYPSRRLSLTLHRQTDLAAHFLTSALISLFAGDQIANLAGLQKELNDANGGSGFSLEDLMADRAGARFAQKITANKSSAQRAQQKLAGMLYDDELLPNPDALPKDQGNISSLSDAKYKAQLRRYERQIDGLLRGLSLYQ